MRKSMVFGLIVCATSMLVLFQNCGQHKLSDDMLEGASLDCGFSGTTEFATIPQGNRCYNEIGSNGIVSSYVDSKGVLYLATYIGLSISYDHGETFVTKTTADGLRSNLVSWAYEGASGELYVGTGWNPTGVSVSYDGGKTFADKPMSYLPENSFVKSMYSDDQGNFYAGTSKGLFVSHDGGETAVSKIDDSVDSIFVDSQGTLYVAAKSGLYISSDNGESFDLKSTSNGLTGSVGPVHVDSEGTIYVRSAGIRVSHDGGETFILKNEGLEGQVYFYHVNHQGILFVVSQEGLYISHDKGETYIEKIKNNEVGKGYPSSVITDLQGNIYVTMLGGFYISKNGGESFVNHSRATEFASNWVNSIIENQGVLYVASDGGLVASYDRGKTFVKINYDSDLPESGNVWIQALAMDKENIYLGTKILNQGVLYISHDGGKTFEKKIIGGNVTALHLDSEGVLYVGTKSAGLFISNDGGGTFTTKTTANGLGSDDVKAILKDSEGTLYVATSGGLSILHTDEASFTNKTTDNGLQENSVQSLHMSSQGVLYVGNNTHLATSKDKGETFEVISGPYEYVYSIDTDSEGTLYVAVGKDGLLISQDEGGSFQTKTYADGLGPELSYVYAGSNGVLYVGSYDNGLQRTRP